MENKNADIVVYGGGGYEYHQFEKGFSMQRYKIGGKWYVENQNGDIVHTGTFWSGSDFIEKRIKAIKEADNQLPPPSIL